MIPSEESSSKFEDEDQCVVAGKAYHDEMRKSVTSLSGVSLLGRAVSRRRRLRSRRRLGHRSESERQKNRMLSHEDENNEHRVIGQQQQQQQQQTVDTAARLDSSTQSS